MNNTSMLAVHLSESSRSLAIAGQELRRANENADPVAGLFTLALIERAVMLERNVLALAQAIAARGEA